MVFQHRHLHRLRGLRDTDPALDPTVSGAQAKRSPTRGMFGPELLSELGLGWKVLILST